MIWQDYCIIYIEETGYKKSFEHLLEKRTQVCIIVKVCYTMNIVRQHKFYLHIHCVLCIIDNVGL